ncbi:hypothetical protein ACEQ8H_004258 [Pleosporales sp. CAS-2024a]
MASTDTLREAAFLQQLLKIRDDVFASKHPRIHLPAKVIEQVAPRLPQPPQPTPPATVTTNGTPNGVSASQLLPPRPDSSLQAPSAANKFVPPAPAQRPFLATCTTSSIDPVLLTKSDHLIRAELQLKRQQIERLLKDQFDKKGRGNDADEREAHLDVEQCLIQAQLRVPPVSGIRSTTNHSDGAESFDENSYYSSKAGSWSSEENDPKRTADAEFGGLLTSQTKHVSNVSAQPAVIDLDEEAYEPADDIEIYEPEPATLLDDAEEEDYSPPPADIIANEPSRGRGRNQNHRGANGSSRRQSPNGPAPPLQNPRKRRRDEKREEKKRQQQTNKQAMTSPEPYIKEEPQSPPPVAAFSETQASKRRALPALPAHEADAASAQSPGRYQPIYYGEPESRSPVFREYGDGSSSSVICVPQRKVHREEQDLRRVASLQHARRPYSPGVGELYAREVRQLRSVSHAFVDRNDVPVYREASARPSAVRHIRDRSRSPVHEYIARAQSPIMMAPPPRRIVVDQFGNKYYAAPVEARESVAPPIRRAEVDLYYERAVTREPSMRAPRAELYEGDTMQRMPPPPRRYMENPVPEMIEAQGYRQREASRRPADVEYRPQYEEMVARREYVPARAYSMRPEGVRQEPAEGYLRHESMQPGSMRAPQPQYREVSMVRQEPVDDGRYYSVAPQGRRYVDEEAVELAPEPYAPEPRRVYTRY